MKSRAQNAGGDRREDRGATTSRCRRLLSIEQAAGSHRALEETIRRWIADGELKAYKVADGQIRIDQVEFADFLSSPASKRPPRFTPGQEVEHTGPPRSLRLLSIKQAADYAKVSAQTIRRWIKASKLKFYRAGRQIRIDESDLVRFISL